MSTAPDLISKKEPFVYIQIGHKDMKMCQNLPNYPCNKNATNYYDNKLRLLNLCWNNLFQTLFWNFILSFCNFADIPFQFKFIIILTDFLLSIFLVRVKVC